MPQPVPQYEHALLTVRVIPTPVFYKKFTAEARKRGEKPIEHGWIAS